MRKNALIRKNGGEKHKNAQKCAAYPPLHSLCLQTRQDGCVPMAHAKSLPKRSQRWQKTPSSAQEAKSVTKTAQHPSKCTPPMHFANPPMTTVSMVEHEIIHSSLIWKQNIIPHHHAIPPTSTTHAKQHRNQP